MISDESSVLRPHEVRAVFNAVASSDHEVSVLTVAQATSLSTLVVVPALDHLCERGLVIKLAHPAGRRSWVYRLTAQGRRARRESA